MLADRAVSEGGGETTPHAQARCRIKTSRPAYLLILPFVMIRYAGWPRQNKSTPKAARRLEVGRMGSGKTKPARRPARRGQNEPSPELLSAK